jgi:hypothetical protein
MSHTTKDKQKLVLRAKRIQADAYRAGRTFFCGAGGHHGRGNTG